MSKSGRELLWGRGLVFLVVVVVLLLLFFFEAGFYCVALTILELTLD